MERGQLEVVGVSGLSSKKVYFKWALNNFNILVNETDDIFLPEFQVKLSSDCTKWMIILRPCPPSGYSCAIIHLKEASYPKVEVTVDYKLLNSFGENLDSLGPTSMEISEGSSCLTPSKIVWRNNTDMLKKISHDNKVLLFINLNASVTTHPASKPPIANSFSNSSSIVNDFATLRKDEESSDFTISVCGNEFHVHKIILGARSPVFSSMFKHEMKESNSGKLEIVDIEPEVFEEFLNFIYTGNANIKGNASELLAAAEKYDVQDFKAFCENALIKDLSKENCFKSLILGDLYSAKNLKKQAINFIVSNNHVNKNGLAEIEDTSLAKELVEAFMNQRN